MRYRIRLAGYEAASYVPFYQYGSTTLATTPERQSEISGAGRRFEANRDYYLQKWGGLPGEERFAKSFNGLRR